MIYDTDVQEWSRDVLLVMKYFHTEKIIHTLQRGKVDILERVKGSHFQQELTNAQSTGKLAFLLLNSQP